MKTLTIAFKDLTRSLRSAFAVGMSVAAPLLLIGLIYFAFEGTSNGAPALPAVKVGVVNADRLPPDTPIDHALGEDIRSLFFNESVGSWITAFDYPDEASARAAMDQHEIGVAVIIPRDFSKRTLAGERDIQVRMISDPALTIAAKRLQNMVTVMLDGVAGKEIVVQTILERFQTAGLQLDPAQILGLIERYDAWYADFQQDISLVMLPPSVEGASENPVQNVLGLMMAGQMVFFAFFTGAYAMMSILREDEEGTLARLFTAPVPRTSVLAGKFISVFLSVIVQGVVLIAAAHFAFKINWGTPLAVVMALTGQVIAAAGLGVLLISFVKTTQQAGPILGGGLTVLAILGGLFSSGLQLPEAFTMLAIFTPQGWVIKTWNIVLSGQPLVELMGPFVVLMVMGTVMFVIGARLFQKRLAS